MNPAHEFEKTVRTAVQAALNNGVPPSLVVGSLAWIQMDTRELVLMAHQGQSNGAVLPAAASDILNLGKLPKN